MKKQKILASIGLAGMVLVGTNATNIIPSNNVLNAESINETSVTYTSYNDFISDLTTDPNQILDKFGVKHDGNATMVNQQEYINFRYNASLADGVDGYSDSMILEINYLLPGSFETGSMQMDTFYLNVNLDYQYDDEEVVAPSDASVTYTSYNDFISDLTTDPNQILDKFGVKHDGNATMVNQQEYINFRYNASKATSGYSDSMIVTINYYVPGAISSGSMQMDTFNLEINLNF